MISTMSKAIAFNNKGVRRNGSDPGNCLVCGKRLKRKNTKCCSNKCDNVRRKSLYVERWLEGKEDGKSGQNTSVIIKEYLFDKYDCKCQECGWGEKNPHTKKMPLTIHHVDGNAENNRPENLKLLCPNCHSLTSTYGGSNKGNGRKKRREYRKAALV